MSATGRTRDDLMVRAQTLLMDCALLVENAVMDTPDQRRTVAAQTKAAATGALDGLERQEVGLLHHILLMWWVHRELDDVALHAIRHNLVEPIVAIPAGQHDPDLDAWLEVVPPYIVAAARHDNAFVIYLWQHHTRPDWAAELCALWATPGRRSHNHQPSSGPRWN